MAKITTITNPLTGQPAQVDQLDHTAQEIDDAIARALPGGAIDMALQNKAPSGFGYGEVQSIVFWNDDDGTKLEQNLDSKFTSDSMRNKVFRAMLVDYPICKVSGNGGFADIFVDNSNDSNGYPNNILIVFYAPCNSVVGPSRATKQKINGTWYPWEYANPPMELGVEYRTTERRNGLPVYTQFNNLGKIVNGAYGDISVTNLDSVVGYEAFWVNRPLPIIKNSSLTDAETQYLNVYVLNANTIRVYYYGGTSVSGNGDVYVLVKYTRN